MIIGSQNNQILKFQIIIITSDANLMKSEADFSSMLALIHIWGTFLKPQYRSRY